MEFINYFLDIVLHLDRHLIAMVNEYGLWIYAILFLIIFCETGLVVVPFLPGDSLLFVAGTLAGIGMLDPVLLIIGLTLAAILGDTVNYWIGHRIGPSVFYAESGYFFKREHLLRTQRFYEKHGGKTIIIARFIPIIRTFAPFVAGIGAMSYKKFMAYNVTGGVIWVVLFIAAGYFFGDLPWVKKNLTAVIFAIIVLSIMPGVIEYVRHKMAQKNAH